MGSLPRFVSASHPRESGDPEFPGTYGLPLARERRVAEFSDRLLGLRKTPGYGMG